MPWYLPVKIKQCCGKMFIPAMSPVRLIALISTNRVMYSLKGILIATIPFDVAWIAISKVLSLKIRFFCYPMAKRLELDNSKASCLNGFAPPA
jgi:ACR3 family arsenite transporter